VWAPGFRAYEDALKLFRDRYGFLADAYEIVGTIFVVCPECKVLVPMHRAGARLPEEDDHYVWHVRQGHVKPVSNDTVDDLHAAEDMAASFAEVLREAARAFTLETDPLLPVRSPARSTTRRPDCD